MLWLGPPRQATNAAVVKAGELLFLLNDTAELIVARASQDAFVPLKSYTVAEQRDVGAADALRQTHLRQRREQADALDGGLTKEPSIPNSQRSNSQLVQPFGSWELEFGS